MLLNGFDDQRLERACGRPENRSSCFLNFLTESPGRDWTRVPLAVKLLSTIFDRVAQLVEQRTSTKIQIWILN